MSNTPHTSPAHNAVLLLPRLRVQNANAISSPLTWGFPAISAFLGAMTALERKLGPGAGISFFGVGVVCHGHEAQISTEGYTRAFRLTRNPVLADGSSAALVEEGRIHLDISLLFDVQITSAHLGPQAQQALADLALLTLEGLRIAGGSVLTPERPGRRHRPQLVLRAGGDDEQKAMRQLLRQCLPGFTLVSRDDLLQQHWQNLKAHTLEATQLDAWLDLVRLNHRAVLPAQVPGDHAAPPVADQSTKVQWQADTRDGWIVPIPVGYAPLTALQPPGTVAGARDRNTPFRFVEPVWSLGQWLSPHRLQSWDHLFWQTKAEGPAHEPQLYRCTNGYQAPNASLASTAAAVTAQI